MTTPGGRERVGSCVDCGVVIDRHSKRCRPCHFGRMEAAHLVACDCCGKEMRRYKAASRSRHFCSLVCRGAKSSGAANPNWKGGRVEVACRQCGATFSRIPGSSQSLCSVACKALTQKTRKPRMRKYRPRRRYDPAVPEVVSDRAPLVFSDLSPRPVPGFPGLLATYGGHIIGPQGFLLHTKPDRDRYPTITAYRDGRRSSQKVHRLVALAWFGPPPSKRHLVAHGDGVRFHNCVENLRWATPKENVADMMKHGTHRFFGRRRVSIETVRRIRERLSGGAAVSEVAADLKIWHHTVNNIRRGITWKNVA